MHDLAGVIFALAIGFFIGVIITSGVITNRIANDPERLQCYLDKHEWVEGQCWVLKSPSTDK